MGTSSAIVALVLLLSAQLQCALSGHVHKYDYKLKIKEFTLSSVLNYNENDGQLIIGSLSDITITSSSGAEVPVPDAFKTQLAKPFGIGLDFRSLKLDPSDPEWSRNMKRGLVSLFSGLETLKQEKHALETNANHFHDDKQETIYGLCPVTTGIKKLGENLYDTGRSIDVSACVSNSTLSYVRTSGTKVCGLDMSISQTMLYKSHVRQEADGSSLILTKSWSKNDVHHLGFDHIEIEQVLTLLEDAAAAASAPAELSPDAESASIRATYNSPQYGTSTYEPNVDFVDQILSQLVVEQSNPILLALDIANEFYIFKESDFSALLNKAKDNSDKVHLLYHFISSFRSLSGLKALNTFTAANLQYQTSFAEYLQALPFGSGKLNKEGVDYLASGVCNADHVKDNDYLQSSCLLSLASILDKDCAGFPGAVRPGDCDTSDLKRIFDGIKVVPSWSWELDDYSGFPIQSVILALKVVKNSGFRFGTDFFAKVIRNKAMNIHIRATAAWTGVNAKPEHLRVYSAKFLTRMFDETEDHEIRNAAFVAFMASGPSKGELAIVAHKLKAQIANGDRQFYLPAIQSFKLIADRPEFCNPKFTRDTKSVYNEILKPVEASLGPVSMLDSQVKSKTSGNITTIVAVYAFESGASPRSYYRRTAHNLGNTDFSVRSDNENLLRELVKSAGNLKAEHLMAHVDKPIAISYGRNGKDVAFAYASLSTIIRKLQKSLNHQSFELKHHYMSLALSGSGLPVNFYSWQDGLTKRSAGRDKSGHPLLDVHYNYGTILMSSSVIPGAGVNHLSGKYLRKELNAHLGVDTSGVRVRDLRDMKLNLTIELLAEDEAGLDLYRESLQTYSHCLSGANKPLRYTEIAFDPIPADQFNVKKMNRLSAYTGLDLSINTTLSDAQRGSPGQKLHRVLREWQPYGPLIAGRRTPYSTVVTLRGSESGGANLNIGLDYKAKIITNERSTRNSTLSIYDGNNQLTALLDLDTEYVNGESLLLVNVLAKSAARGNKVINIQSKMQFSKDLSASTDAQFEAVAYADELGTRQVASVKGTMSRVHGDYHHEGEAEGHGHHQQGQGEGHHNHEANNEVDHHQAHGDHHSTTHHDHHSSSAQDITSDLLNDQKHYRFNKAHFEITYSDGVTRDDVTLLPKFWDYMIGHYTIKKHDRSTQSPSKKNAELTIRKHENGLTDVKIKSHMGTFEFDDTDLRIPLGAYKKVPIYGKSIVHQLKPGFVGHICSFSTQFGLKTFDSRTITKETDPNKLFGNCDTLIAETEEKSFRVKRTALKVTIEYNNEITVEITRTLGSKSSILTVNGQLVDAQEGKTVSFPDFYQLLITGKYEVSLPNGYIVYVCDQVEDVIVKVNLLDRNNTKGLCGNNNGDGRDDQVAKDGQTRIENPADFIKEYTDASC